MDEDYDYDDFQDFEGGYGYGDEDFEYEEGGGYADEPEEPEFQEDDFDFVMGARDYDRVGGTGPMAEMAGKRFMDPRDRALSEFRRQFKKCTDDRVDITAAENKIKNSRNLLNLNMELLSVAACYRMRHKKFDSETLTKFISKNRLASEHNPIDIIRYIKYYDEL